MTTSERCPECGTISGVNRERSVFCSHPFHDNIGGKGGGPGWLERQTKLAAEEIADNPPWMYESQPDPSQDVDDAIEAAFDKVDKARAASRPDPPQSIDDCECSRWARIDASLDQHHPDCPHTTLAERLRKAERELRQEWEACAAQGCSSELDSEYGLALADLLSEAARENEKAAAHREHWREHDYNHGKAEERSRCVSVLRLESQNRIEMSQHQAADVLFQVAADLERP